MNLKRIPARGMLGVSRVWMDDEMLMAELAKNILGRALANEIESKHQYLADRLYLRTQMERQQGELTESIAGAVGAFDRIGRAFHGAFDVLAEATADPALAAHYQKLQGFFFPVGLQILMRTYLEKIGAIEELSRMVTPELMEELSAVAIGDSSLAELYQEWVAAAHELRRCVHARTRMQESIRRDGTKASDINARAARNEWVRMVRTVLVAADTLNLSDAGREGLMGPLRRAVDQAARNAAEEEEEVEEVEEEIEGEDDAVEDGEEAGDEDIGELDEITGAAGDEADSKAAGGVGADSKVIERPQLTA